MPAKKKSDLDALQGTWNVSALEIDGQEMSAVPPGATITLKGTKFATSGMGADYKGDLVLDDAAKPKAFDLKFTTGPEKGNTSYGIYQLDGDEWKMCLTLRGGKRPAKFATKAGDGLALQTLARAPKAASKTASKAAVPTGEIAPELDGEWTIAQLVIDGIPMADAMLGWGRRVVTQGEVKVMMGPQTVLHTHSRVECGHEPGWMNYVHAKGGAVQLGIFKLEGDTLTTCMAKAGAPRATKFESPKKSGNTLGVWKRTS
jgi:uncharacterized protein (TIGR03067 family)